MSERDDLVAKAKARADAGGLDESWGELVDLDEDESFVGRYRGLTADPQNDRPIHLFWGENGELRWSRSYAALDRELEEARPQIGDRIVVYRGRNYKTAFDGDEGPKGRSFGVVCEPTDEPPPAEGAPADDGIPF
jgi:hypothetical protein